MKITKISLFKYNKPFKLTFHSSHLKRTSPESVIVCLEFDSAISGYGESTPRSYVTGENCQDVIETIQNIFSPVIFSCEINTLDDVHGIINLLEKECTKKGRLRYTSALGSIDIALLDALGKNSNIAVIDLLGPTVRNDMPYSITVPFLSLEKIEDLFYKIEPLQLKYIKVLIGASENENIERVRLIRSLLGDEVDIRLEANGKLTFQESLSAVRSLARYNISAIEQPVDKGDIEGLARFRKISGIPVIVDESVMTIEDVRKIIKIRACDIINIKLSKCGGILRSKEIARFAESENMLCQMGAHVGETMILYEAGRAFAMTTSNLKYFEGCSFLLFQNFFKDPVQMNKNRVSGPGLGLAESDEMGILDESQIVQTLAVKKKRYA